MAKRSEALFGGWHMNRILYYARIYRQYLALNIERAMAFRVHFFLLILLDVFFYSVTLLTIDFTFSQVGPLNGWTREHFLFFASFMLAVDQLHMTFLSESFWIFSVDLRTGALDFTLLRPANPIFITFFRFIRVGSLMLFFIPLGLLIYFGMQLGLTPLAWGALPVMVLCSLALVVAIEIALLMSAFWLVDSTGVNFLRMQLQDISRWPDFVYQTTLRRFFTFAVPVLLASTMPVRFLFNQSEWPGVLLLLAFTAVGIALISFFWRRGLRRYESASS
jgi:ABC-2 type transport system permease protein